NKTRTVVSAYSEESKKKKLSVHQLLTMASLIEEEATEKADRKTIASVFYNRMKKGMMLQTDPTVLYAQGKHKDRVLFEDLEVDSPYNTYQNTGLPPGPIANAGKSSIEASLEPEKTDYYYFLATKEGAVIFTKTLEEHNKAKEKYITSKN
ncbi:MAG: endolytic transglycosylase MltG, partial [Bacillus sp. (in: firmicutes)]